jgi:transcriptional regulator with XRE-family HTH domain
LTIGQPSLYPCPMAPVSIRKHPGPRAYLTDRVTHQSVKLAGRYVDLKALAEGEGLDHGYVSRIMSGERTPSIPYLLKIAAGFKMSVDNLLTAIDERRAQLHAQHRRKAG